jgi:hypothetical protein
MLSAGAAEGAAAGAGSVTTVESVVVSVLVVLELQAYIENIPAAKRIVNSFFMACFFVLAKSIRLKPHHVAICHN